MSIMNRNSRFTTAALVALLAGAPVAVFAQSNPPGTPSTAADSSVSGNSTANPDMETAAAPNSSVSGNNVQSGATTRQGYNGQARMNTGTEQTLSQSTLENVQQQLQQQGFYRTGKVDGRWGPETHQAVLSFQQSKGLQTTGQLDRQTLDALGVHKQGG